MERNDLIQKVIKMSNHFALSDEQQETLKECASLLKSDDDEIRFLKQMQLKMVQNFSEDELGEMVYGSLHDR